MKHFGSLVLGEGLKHNGSKTEPRTRTRTQLQMHAASEVQDGPVENSANPEAAACRTMRCGVAS